MLGTWGFLFQQFAHYYLSGRVIQTHSSFQRKVTCKYSHREVLQLKKSPFYPHSVFNVFRVVSKINSDYFYIYIYRCPTRCNNAQCMFFISLQKLLYMFRVPFTPIIKSTGNCSRRPLVQVICHDRLESAASNPLESIHSQATTTLHHGQVKTLSLNMTVVECDRGLTMDNL
jgi:hypothetical protein